jgi:predicted RNA methylase
VTALRKGWFIIPGVQDGDRTIKEQMAAVLPALAEAADKRVLDLGCAEGLMTLEFHKAGAAFVHGMEYVEEHVAVARQLSENIAHTRVKFSHVDLRKPPPVEQYDIVLCLGVLHKLLDPAPGLSWAISCTKDLILMRSGRRQTGGWIYSKHRDNLSVDSHAVLKESGFVLERSLLGPPPHEERVDYWRRQCGSD